MPASLLASSAETTTESDLNSIALVSHRSFFAKKFSAEDECRRFAAPGGSARDDAGSQAGGYRLRLRRAYRTLEVQGILDDPGRRHYGREHSC